MGAAKHERGVEAVAASSLCGETCLWPLAARAFLFCCRLLLCEVVREGVGQAGPEQASEPTGLPYIARHPTFCERRVQELQAGWWPAPGGSARRVLSSC